MLPVPDTQIIRDSVVLTTRQKVVRVILLCMILSLVLAAWYVVNNYGLFESQATTTDLAMPSAWAGTLYFSGIPDNGLNELPNIFSLSVPDGVITQKTGVGVVDSLHMGYAKDVSTGHEFMLLPNSDIGGQTKLEPFVVYPGADNSGEREVHNLAANSGLYSNTVALAPDANRLAFVTHYPESSNSNQPTIPDFDAFSTWTVAVLTQGEDGNESIYFENAVKPVWVSADSLLFLRADAIYVHNFVSGETRPLITPAEIGFSAFTNTDSMTIVTSSDGQKIALYKDSTNELLLFENIALAIESEVQLTGFDTLSLQLSGNRKVHQILNLGSGIIATLQSNAAVRSMSDQIVTYNVLSADEAPIPALQVFSLEGVTLPGATTLDVWIDTLFVSRTGN